MKYYLTQEGRELLNEMDPRQVTGTSTKGVDTDLLGHPRKPLKGAPRTMHGGYESDSRKGGDKMGIGGNRQRALAVITQRELGRLRPTTGKDVGGIKRRDARRAARKSIRRAFAGVLPSTSYSQAADRMGISSEWGRSGPHSYPQAYRQKRTAWDWEGKRPRMSYHDTTLEPAEQRPMAGPKGR